VADGLLYYVMPMVEGETLRQRLGRRPPLSLPEALHLATGIASALSHAHAHDVIHRDIKPENVIVRRDGYVKVLDFGIARLGTSANAETMMTSTSPSLVLGTPRYMSPEQARGEPASSATDVFSLGIVLYELATAKHPFDASSVLALLHAIASDTPARPRQWVADLPDRFEQLLLRMLAKSATDRPTADEVANELAVLAAGAAKPSPRPRELHLPVPLTPLVGRDAEVAAITARIRDDGVRLLTLTGPGGTGKTRVAIQAARDLTAYADGGVTFVNLAPIADARLVMPTVARALGVREVGDAPLAQSVEEHLRGLGRTLLVIDNFEHVIEGATVVKALLDACPDVQVLATSRLALGVYGERELAVPALPLPPPSALFSPSTLVAYGAVALFVDRAASVRPGFTLTPKNAASVVEICRRLDGLPLAIELAAARVKILPPADLLARIAHPLDLLTGGARDLPARQQTLRAAIKWSYDLLSHAEQTLFRRLSVFAGGCTLEAAEAVCNAAEDLDADVLDGIAALVNNSLLVQHPSEDGEPRFDLLETFREYGREQMAERGEAALIERAHAAYMLVLAEEETPEMSPAERVAWLRRCDVEHDNFRKAINTLVACDDGEWGLRLTAALFRFWEQHDHLTGGREALESVLRLPSAARPTKLRARALQAMGMLADIQGDLDTSLSASHEARRIYQQEGDRPREAAIQLALATNAQRRGHATEAVALFGEAVALWESLGDFQSADLAKTNMGNAAKSGGDLELAGRLFQQVVEAARARGDVRAEAFALNGLGDLEATRGDFEAGRRYHQESLERYRAANERWGMARVLEDLAEIDLRSGDCTDASIAVRAALRAFIDLGHQRGVARQLEALARCHSTRARDEAAVKLLGAASAIRQRIGTSAKPAERERVRGTIAEARSRLGDEAYARAWAEGQASSLDDVIRA
jgi:predicted ATPase